MISLLRPIAPLFVLGAGVVGGVVWSHSIDNRLPFTSTPPFWAAQALLIAAALFVATRGVPRWSYPWLALGIGGLHHILRYAIIGDAVRADANVGSFSFVFAAFAAYILAMLMGALIAARSWQDTAFFVAVFLVGTGIGLPPLSSISPDSGLSRGTETGRLIVLAVQVTGASAAILAWQWDVHVLSLALLVGLLVLAPLALGLLFPEALPSDYSVGWLVVDVGRLYAVVAIFTFATGALRRVLGGQGILSGRAPPTTF